MVSTSSSTLVDRATTSRRSDRGRAPSAHAARLLPWAAGGSTRSDTRAPQPCRAGRDRSRRHRSQRPAHGGLSPRDRPGWRASASARRCPSPCSARNQNSSRLIQRVTGCYSASRSRTSRSRSSNRLARAAKSSSPGTRSISASSDSVMSWLRLSPRTRETAGSVGQLVGESHRRLLRHAIMISRHHDIVREVSLADRMLAGRDVCTGGVSRRARRRALVVHRARLRRATSRRIRSTPTPTTA
jgi:hypothetical protein